MLIQNQKEDIIVKIIGAIVLFILCLFVAFYGAYWFITNYMMDNTKQTYYVQTMT